MKPTNETPKTPKTPDPAGWDKPWPFADEVELWRIPDSHAKAGLELELARCRGDVEKPFLSLFRNSPDWAIAIMDNYLKGRGLEGPIAPGLTKEKAALTNYESITFGVSQTHSKAQVIDAIKVHLEQLEADGLLFFAEPEKGKRETAAKNLLESIALARLYQFNHAMPGGRLAWQWLEGTPFKFWADNLADQAESTAERIERITTQASEKIRHLERRMQTG